MKIKYPEEKKISYKFSDLDPGDLFTDDNLYYYLKIDQVKTDPNDQTNLNHLPFINAVDVESGIFMYFQDNDPVMKANATIVVDSLDKAAHSDYD